MLEKFFQVNIVLGCQLSEDTVEFGFSQTIFLGHQLKFGFNSEEYWKTFHVLLGTHAGLRFLILHSEHPKSVGFVPVNSRRLNS